uniref:NADH-ubiquinone oxidoreductase chain 2 n=1 Tax=Dielis plumipes fossulana TaxID=2977626 RepID=A0A1W5LJM6_9HYME|nr:NADH dehydrogenase subunit 2 [Dielis plumipes fossulana]
MNNIVQLNFNKTILIPLYMLILVVSFYVESYLLFWLLMEMGSIILLLVMMLEASVKSDGTHSFLSILVVQVITASSVFFSMFIMDNTLNSLGVMEVMLCTILFMKLGLAPTHKWYEYALEDLSWGMCFIFSTIYKIMPMLFIYKLAFKSHEFIITFCLLSVIFGTIMALKTKKIKKIFTASSVIHMSFMVILIKYNFNIWLMYFTLYMLLMYYFCIYANKFKFTYHFDYFLMESKSHKLAIFVNNMSLAGLPPVVSFFMKGLMFNHLIWEFSATLSTVMLVLNIYSMIFYLLISIPLIMNNNMKFNHLICLNHFVNINMKLMYYINLIAISMFPYLFYVMIKIY